MKRFCVQRQKIIGWRSSDRVVVRFESRETQEQTLDSCCIISHLKLMNLNELDKLEENQLMSTFTAMSEEEVLNEYLW
jgi:hypothetical protein